MNFPEGLDRSDLTPDKDGKYTFAANATATQDPTFTVKDGDGDSVSARMSAEISDRDLSQP